MSEPGTGETRLLLDNNVFIAAIKHPAPNSRVLELLLACLKNSRVTLVGNDILVAEMRKYRELLPSPTANTLLAALESKTKIYDPADATIRDCAPFFPEEQAKDLLHAATAADCRATIVTNDKHFKKIKEAGKITVWSIADAIAALLPKSRMNET